MIRLTRSRIRTLCILADGEPHFAENLADDVNMKLPNFIADVLNPLISNRFCAYGEPIKTHKPGRPPCPIVIPIDELPNIAETVISKIKLRIAKGKSELEKYENARVNGTLTPSLDEKLIEDALLHFDEAERLMCLFKIPLFREGAAKILHENDISYKGLRGLLSIRSGFLPDQPKSEITTPEGFFKEASEQLDYYRVHEIERKKLETDVGAIEKIKELWNKGCRHVNVFAEATGYSLGVVDAMIDQMLACDEISSQHKPEIMLWNLD